MKPLSCSRFAQARATKQRGVVLFFTLIALLAMSLAAVALIRSVDTSTMIAGNLAFKQSATSAGDAAIEAAMAKLGEIQAANTALNITTDPTHPFNITDLDVTPGYHSSADPTLNLFANATWEGTDSCGMAADCSDITDGGGNTMRYLIQRMCRNANQPIQDADCLFGNDPEYTGEMNVPLPQTVCIGEGCPQAGQTPQIRITARVTGPRNTVSYVQTFVY